MALISCPECGGQISSNAEQCIHCGSKFTLCPECQKVHIGVVYQCTECGFYIQKKPIEKTETVTPEKTTQQKTIYKEKGEEYDEIVRDWKKSDSLREIFIRAKSIFKIGSFLMAALLVLIAFLRMKFFDVESIDLNDFVTFPSFVDSCKNLIIAAAVFLYVWMVIEAIYCLHERYSLGGWLRRNKVDFVPNVRRYLNDLKKGKKKKDNVKAKNKAEYSYGHLYTLACAVTVKKDSRMDTASKIYGAVNIFGHAAAIVFLVLLGIDNVEAWSYAIFWSTDFSFVSYKYLWIALGIEAVRLAINEIIYHQETSIIETWIKKTFPDDKELHNLMKQ